ncbi:MAG TPA: DMT family transporter [Rhabdochlamydiaceae bacterium]
MQAVSVDRKIDALYGGAVTKILNFDLKRGVVYVLLAWLFFTLMTTLAKVTSQHTTTPMIILFQNGISLLLLLPWMRKGDFKTDHKGLMLVRALFGLANFALLLFAVEYTSLVNAMLLCNAAPIFIPLVDWIWRRSPINAKLWPGILLGFVGIVLILNPQVELNEGVLFGIASGICLAVSMLCVRRLSHSDDTKTILFYYYAIATVCAFIWSLFYWELPSTSILINLVGIGCLSAMGQYLFNKSFTFAKAVNLGPFNYSAVVYSVLTQWYLWGDVPSWIAFIGILAVCAGGIFTVLFTQPSK